MGAVEGEWVFDKFDDDSISKCHPYAHLLPNKFDYFGNHICANEAKKMRIR